MTIIQVLLLWSVLSIVFCAISSWAMRRWPRQTATLAAGDDQVDAAKPRFRIVVMRESIDVDGREIWSPLWDLTDVEMVALASFRGAGDPLARFSGHQSIAIHLIPIR